MAERRSNIRLLVPFAPSESLRAMARARHVEAVQRLEAGDLDGFFSMLRDVKAIEDEARRARDWERKLTEARDERDERHTGALLILAMASRRGRRATARTIETALELVDEPEAAS